jgi:myo-inositol 2-dehydrogenase / D-chiro-inositol 1-dehydrogenase
MTSLNTGRAPGDPLRLGLVGAGWITPAHLAALDRLDRTRLVGVASARLESATATAAPRGAAAYDNLAAMLDAQRPDVAYVCVPPSAAVAACAELAERGIPFLVEKPLAATDTAGPARIAALVAERGLVAAVGYHLRALDALPEVRERLAAAGGARLVTARWLDGTPAPAWWLREDVGGGQVVEQATHLYDLARLLVGEATVVGAASIREEPVVPAGADVADATAVVLRFETGAVGSFANTRRLASGTVEMELAAPGLLVTIRRAGADPGRWEVAFSDRATVRTIPPGRDPYEVQAEAFLDAVEAGTPAAVLSTYADALRTDSLTRAVVAATGRGG